MLVNGLYAFEFAAARRPQTHENRTPTGIGKKGERAILTSHQPESRESIIQKIKNTPPLLFIWKHVNSIKSTPPLQRPHTPKHPQNANV